MPPRTMEHLNTEHQKKASVSDNSGVTSLNLTFAAPSNHCDAETLKLIDGNDYTGGEYIKG